MAVRINKYLSEAGVCSRREADRMLAQGRICIDGIPALPGQKSGADLYYPAQCFYPDAGRQIMGSVIFPVYDVRSIFYHHWCF